MENLTYEIYLQKIDPHHLFPVVKKAKMMLVPDNSKDPNHHFRWIYDDDKKSKLFIGC